MAHQERAAGRLSLSSVNKDCFSLVMEKGSRGNCGGRTPLAVEAGQSLTYAACLRL